ncbi:hypothetical protein HID58_015139 [Brassica napus]|uniref:Uncharacterized protein n=1 Tax=Brassica napus TaxID=3708 RepID=A0ABQ8DJ54_BRANA|nr:hypothetical protein HID58_015139 [Brassica napus]
MGAPPNDDEETLPPPEWRYKYYDSRAHTTKHPTTMDKLLGGILHWGYTTHRSPQCWTHNSHAPTVLFRVDNPVIRARVLEQLYWHIRHPFDGTFKSGIQGLPHINQIYQLPQYGLISMECLQYVLQKRLNAQHKNSTPVRRDALGWMWQEFLWVTYPWLLSKCNACRSKGHSEKYCK